MKTGFFKIPDESVDVVKHLEGKKYFYDVKTNNKHIVNEHDEGYSLSHDLSYMILGRPEVSIVTTKSGRAVWSESKGYCRTE